MGGTPKQLYKLKNEYLCKHYKSVPAATFYREMFPEGSLERPGKPEDHKPNAIFTVAYRRLEGDSRRSHYARNTIVFDDLGGLQRLLAAPSAGEDEAEFIITAPISYFGRRKCAENAYHLWGMAFDLDGVGMEQLQDLLYQIEQGILPEPTYLVNSGHGFHLYYLFEDPIPLYTYLHKPLNALKHALTDMIWNRYTSTIDVAKRQHQGIFQGFRVVGGPSKLGRRYPVTAFEVGPKRTLQYLNSFVPPENQVDYDEFHHLTLDVAKELYPEWHEKRIVQGKSKGRWVNKPDLYRWWLRQIEAGAFDGNRYNCIAALFSYAVKCDIPKDQVLDDALALVPQLNKLTEHSHNEFTANDVYDACTFYDDAYVRYSISAISARTKIQIPRNKRNYQKQADHLEEARAIRDIRMRRQGRKWTDGNGRPSAEDVVKTWRENNPEGRKVDCIRATGLSKQTVYKWWGS